MKHKNKGFTLIEVLASMVIIAMVFSSVLYGFWKMLETNARIDLSRQLQKEVHFAMIRMADKIRDYSIDYEAYESAGKCGNHDAEIRTKLCVKNPSGESFLFETADRELKMDNSPLLSKKFTIETLNFSITPKADPSNITNPQFQPKVTIYLKAKAKNLEDVSLSLQTTISSRVYN